MQKDPKSRDFFASLVVVSVGMYLPRETGKKTKPVATLGGLLGVGGGPEIGCETSSLNH